MRRNTAYRRISLLLFAVMLLAIIAPTALAADSTPVTGKVYEFEKDGHYEFSTGTAEEPNEENTYGSFSVNGNILETASKNGVPAYKIDDGQLSIMYSYTDMKLNASEDDWHLIDDKSKKLDALSLSSDIMKGAIVVQTSKDRKNWITVGEGCNIFADKPVNTESIYDAQDIQLINGCFYRVIVAYELSKCAEHSNFLFINTSKYDYRKVAEVYEFYAYSSETEGNAVDPQQTYNLGNVVRTEKFEGYEGEKEIVKGDPHYGVTALGQFYVSGYTDTAKDNAGNMVFLKNVGDKVVLWFSLKENIDAVGGNEKIKVTPDNKGSDQYFQTPTTDFGRGTVIVRYTDYNNNAGEPQIYTNYLEANASVGADTKVSLFEEGDYEVALDYELTEDKLIDSIAHYRIFFKFSIRNGNCMIFPFDLATGAELTNSAMTENGFRLDLAKSRYLKVNVKREVMADSADGLVEDTRFNGPAKDGAQYDTDGIYTITVSNQYTGQLTVKKIYVGTNPVLRAYMATGLSIPEINDLVAEGASISEDGTIQMPEAVTLDAEPSATENMPMLQAVETEQEPTEQRAVERNVEGLSEENAEKFNILPFVGIGGAVIVIITVAIAGAKEKRRSSVLKRSENGAASESVIKTEGGDRK